MRSFLLLALVLACGCSREAPMQGSAPQPSTSTALAPSPGRSATVFPSSTASSTNAPPPEEPLVYRQLRTAPISALTITSWSKPGLFQATLNRPNSEGPVQATLMLAFDQQPIAYRKPLAFARLAQALGMHVVPPTVLRRVSTGELGTFFSHEPNVLAYLSAHAVVQNDGTIDALVTAPSRGEGSNAWRLMSRRDIVLDEAQEARDWALAVASAEASPGENTGVLRDYVEALVLDYLAGNVKRRSVLLDETTSELMLAENDGAFPSKIVPSGEARLLDRLKPVVRFPRSIRDILTKFDRVRAREVFLVGAFDTWLLSPRTLMLIEERRSTLLTLIEARIAAYGEQTVLSL